MFLPLIFFLACMVQPAASYCGTPWICCLSARGLSSISHLCSGWRRSGETKRRLTCRRRGPSFQFQLLLLLFLLESCCTLPPHPCCCTSCEPSELERAQEPYSRCEYFFFFFPVLPSERVILTPAGRLARLVSA